MFYHFIDKNVELQRDLPEIPWLVGVRVGAGEEETSVDPGARLQLSCSCQADGEGAVRLTLGSAFINSTGLN